MKLSLCPYKHMFGEPSEGVHSHKIFNLAIVDVLSVFLAAYFISQYYKYNFYEVSIVLFLSGIILHRLFCVRSTIDKLLFA